MTLDHSTETAHHAWQASIGTRASELLRTDKYKNATPGHIPEEALLQASDLFRLFPTQGGDREEYRIELLSGAEQAQARKLYGEQMEWLSIRQVATCRNNSVKSARTELKATIMGLIFEPTKTRIIEGEIRYAASWIRTRLNPEQQKKLDRFVADAAS